MYHQVFFIIISVVAVRGCFFDFLIYDLELKIRFEALNLFGNLDNIQAHGGYEDKHLNCSVKFKDWVVLTLEVLNIVDIFIRFIEIEG